MINKKSSLIFLLVVSVLLSGCFGLFGGGDKEIDHIEISAGKEGPIEPETSIILTVIGKAEDNSTITIEPEEDAWVLVTEDAGELVVDENNTATATFTAAEDFAGMATVKVEYEEFTDEIEIEVIQFIVEGVAAYSGIVDQGSISEEYHYEKSDNELDRDGVNPIDDARGYAEETAFSHWNWYGHWLAWNINVPEAGDYLLVIRYATKEESQYTNRTLAINGEEIYGEDDPVELPSTGGFAGYGAVDEWGYQVVDGITIEEPGDVEVKLTHAGVPEERKGTNMAWLALVSPANVVIDDDFIFEIEDRIGIERVEEAW